MSGSEVQLMDCLMFALPFIAALGSGLIGGVFFAFSALVMKALGRLPPAGGIAAMQSINVAVLNPVFFGAFFGTAILGPHALARGACGFCMLHHGVGQSGGL